MASATTDTRQVPRPRPVLAAKHARRIRKAQQAQADAQSEIEAAVLAALADGASYLAITDATGIAATTIARYVKAAG